VIQNNQDQGVELAKTHCIRFAHGASLSTAIGKFHNAEIECFGHKLFVHDLIRGSLAVTG
jgi:hypothetical protein